jgi:DNA-binding response OmpR family regulator
MGQGLAWGVGHLAWSRQEGARVSELVGRPTALVVDDEFLIALELESALQAAGYEVLTAVTPAEAHALLGQRRVDVAVLDFRMGADSVALAHALGTQSIPFFFCTGSLPEEVEAVFPGVRMITKPFSGGELLAAIAAVSGKR